MKQYNDICKDLPQGSLACGSENNWPGVIPNEIIRGKKYSKNINEKR